MKKRIHIFCLMAGAAFFFALMLTSCEKSDPDLSQLADKSPVYELTGAYDVTDECYDESEAYRLVIGPWEDNEDEILLINFLNRDVVARAHYQDGRFVIPHQNLVTPTEVLWVSGEIENSPAEGLIIVYRLQSGHDISNCGARCVPSGTTVD